MKIFLDKKAVLTYYLLLVTFSFFAQETRNLGFTKPMNLPFNLAGSFGEPRPDHFHSGIDIKTNGVEGEPVFAVYDGYISRIRVSPYGYGRAIYITHTNGYTSVYGHLNRFTDAIQQYINQQHYLLKQSELDLTFDATKFPIKQNDTIAFSGNTGGSDAPHLHFEIRNTKTEHALNPLDFYPSNFYIDTIPPQINKVKVNQFDSNFYNAIENKMALNKQNNFYTTAEPFYVNENNNFSFSLEGFDKQDNSENKNGIKKIEVFQKDSLLFKYDLTEIDYDKTRMCNAFVDYNEMMNDSGYFYNCYRLKNNTLSYYSNGDGFFILEDGQNKFNIICYDYNDNTTKISLDILKKIANEFQVDSVTTSNPQVISKNITSSKADSISNKNFKIKFAANTFYDDIYLDVEQKTGKIFKIKNSNSLELIPLQKAAKIEFESSNKINRNKIVIFRQDNKGKETALKTTFDKKKFYADTKELGSFYLKYDTTKPTIEIINYKLGIINFDAKIQVKILDNLSGINSYNGYIDDNWVNFYYDAKNNVIEYTYDKYCTKGEHSLKIIVTDNVGNKNTITQKFAY